MGPESIARGTGATNWMTLLFTKRALEISGWGPQKHVFTGIADKVVCVG